MWHDCASRRTVWLAKQVANIPARREGMLPEAEADNLPFTFCSSCFLIFCEGAL